jgi:hypothetical protein
MNNEGTYCTTAVFLMVWQTVSSTSHNIMSFFFLLYIYTLFTLHALLLWSNTTCIVVTYLYNSLPFLFILRLLITIFYL